MVAQVLVPDAGAHIGDLGALGEAVDDEGVQPIVVLDGDMVRKSSPPETTNTPTVSGRVLTQSRNPSMLRRDGGRMRTAIRA